MFSLSALSNAALGTLNPEIAAGSPRRRHAARCRRSTRPARRCARLAQRGEHDFVVAAGDHGQPALALADRHHALLDERRGSSPSGSLPSNGFGRRMTTMTSRCGLPITAIQSRTASSTRPSPSMTPAAASDAYSAVWPTARRRVRRHGPVAVHRRYERSKPQRGRHLLDAEKRLEHPDSGRCRRQIRHRLPPSAADVAGEANTAVGLPCLRGCGVLSAADPERLARGVVGGHHLVEHVSRCWNAADRRLVDAGVDHHLRLFERFPPPCPRTPRGRSRGWWSPMA